MQRFIATAGSVVHIYHKQRKPAFSSYLTLGWMKGRNTLEAEGMRKMQAYQTDPSRLFASPMAQMVAAIRRDSVIDAG